MTKNSFDYYPENKRFKDGRILRLDVMNNLSIMSQRFFKYIESHYYIKILTKEFENKKIKLYFEKFVFNKFIPISNKISVHKWYIEQGLINPSEPIEINETNYTFLLKYIWPEKNIKWIIIKNNKNKFKKFLINFYRNFFTNIEMITMFMLKSFFKKKNNFFLIAVQYNEGIDLNKRSDIFWLLNSNIKNSDIIIYFENKFSLNRYENFNYLKNTANLKKITYLKLFSFFEKSYFSFKNKKFLDISISFNNFKRINEIDYLLSFLGKRLIDNTSFWYNFFNTYKIKISFDPTEAGLSHLEKNIALDLLGGISIGKERTFMFADKFDYFGHFSDNIHFTWSNYTSKKYSITNNIKENILISGFPYNRLNSTKKNELKKIKNTFKKNGSEFTLLILDDRHSYGRNLNSFQVLYTPLIEKIYQLLLKDVINNPNFSIIIKSKKNRDLNELELIQPLIKKAIMTKRCHICEDALGTKSSDFAESSDFILSIGPNLSAALMECVLLGKRGVFLDTFYRKLQDKKLYSSLENNCIYYDFKKFYKDFNLYKVNPANNSFGNWKQYLDLIDSFNDDFGHQRIGKYVEFLISSFNKNLKKEEAIYNANNLYKNNYGDDKVISYFDENS